MKGKTTRFPRMVLSLLQGVAPLIVVLFGADIYQQRKLLLSKGAL